MIWQHLCRPGIRSAWTTRTDFASDHRGREHATQWRSWRWRLLLSSRRKLLGVCFACWVLNPTGVGSSGSQDDFLHFVCRDYLRMIRLVAFASNEWDNGPEVMPCLRLS